MMWSPRVGGWCRIAAGLGLAIALGALPAAAQDTGTVSGTVVDNSSQVIPGASVSLTNEATGDTRTAPSDERGVFAFRAVSPGTYTLTIALQGFRSHEQKHNVVNASARLDVGTVKLEVGTLTEVVSVVAEGAAIETRNSDYSGLLTATQISQIQTRGRDVLNLLRLIPGVHYEADIEAMGDSFGSTIPNINGMRKHWNQVTVDGLNGNELSGTSRMNSSINLDAIAEVKVLLNTYKAEFGHSGGANIEIVSKSGSASYQGSAYWYGKRDAWNANAWENNKSGLPRPKLHIDTPGFNLGGPVRIPGLYQQKTAAKKLFFFYSFEAPQVQRPGPIRLYRMPTAAERQGDFSQTLDANGRLVFIKDPNASAACSVTTGGAGCFPGNIIPQTRFDPNALALMQLMPLPNTSSVNNSFNFQRQETSTNPRFNNLLRLDGHPSANNALWGALRTWSSSQYGSEITAGPAKWGFFDGSYVSGDNSINGGWNHVFGAAGVNELSAGYRRATEGFGTKEDSDLSKIEKTNVGYTLGQFTSLNTLGVIPQITFGVSTTGTTSPDFTYDSRLGSTAFDYLMNVRDNLTFTRGRHTLKVGGHLEYMANNEARGGTWMGQFQFNNNNNNPLNTNFAFSNMLLGVYQQYSETSRYGDTQNRQIWSEFYGQDTWQATPRLTVDYGLRFLVYTPYWRPDRQIANFDPALYNPADAPRLYQPALLNGTRVAVDPASGQVLNQIFIGAYVPNSGNQANGMVLQTDPGVPRGFRQVLAPAPEPRVGFSWDLTGEGRMALHGSAGIFHNARLGGGSSGNLRNPPFITNPVIPNNSMANTFVPGVSLLVAPSTIEALETDYKTPSSYNWSIGLRRELGWGTSMDATYAGSAGRNLEMYYNLNAVPDGAKFLDQNSANHDPGSTSATAVLPDNFLRPFAGYGAIRVRGNSATSDYHALQVQLNRRYIHGVQFGAAYTLQRARGLADEDPGNLSIALDRPRAFFYSELAQSNRHALVINYSWDISHDRFNGIAHYALDGWQLSGENALVSGDWAPVVLTTSDNFDFTGGDGGTGGDLGGGLRIVVPVQTCDPMAHTGSPLTGYFDTSCFARPASRGDYGNAPRNAVRKPGIDNWNLALFKNFHVSGRRSFQYRLEAYNVLNSVQFQDIDRTARFDPSGAQINANFGTANGIATPTRPPRTLQMSVRFNF
jgi:hypothetical protein